MQTPARVATAVATGYLLGRTKKLKLAISVGGLLAGQRIATHPGQLLAQGSKLVENNPELKKIKGDVTGRLMDAAKSAAIATATQRIESLNQSLAAAAPELGSGDEEPEGDEGEEGEELEEEPEADEPEEEPEDEGVVEEEPPEEEPPARKSAKKAPAKKSAAKKSAKKAPAKKAAAKKSAAKKTASKKSGAKKSSSRSTRSSSRK